MKTKAVRLYGKNDLRLDTFDLPPIKDNEILVKIISDSVCMSTYKLSKQGQEHKRAPEDLANNPAIIGHEMSGVIIDVGSKWENKYSKGQKFTVQPALTVNGKDMNPGYYYPTYGGVCTYCIIPNEAIEGECLIPFGGESFFEASLAEPVACIIAGYNRMYHTNEDNHNHNSGVLPGGNVLIMGACGPMGLECVDYALQLDPPAKLVVAVDVDSERLKRAEALLAPRAHKDTKLVFLDASACDDVCKELMSLSEEKGYNDAFVYAPIRELIEQADKVLAFDGCMNFFAGPIDKTLSATINMYNIHYNLTHILGYTGSINDDLLSALKLMEKGSLNPAIMITHIGGINSAIDTTLNLPNIKGGKKIIYTQIDDLPLTAIDDFEALGKDNELFRKLYEACNRHNGCWNVEAEEILLKHYNIDINQ